MVFAVASSKVQEVRKELVAGLCCGFIQGAGNNQEIRCWSLLQIHQRCNMSPGNSWELGVVVLAVGSIPTQLLMRAMSGHACWQSVFLGAFVASPISSAPPFES